ncbi:hypothetical protein M8998_10680 [Sphingobacterium sp. lm-10]|uniref:hypothetical protein n=1 Tax=Sphingobacterium sp. lm-10 TaxID=2944904 RepID=UPI0020211095|nr:hypothetical protein [Sphingobacterium sp. lm-10]MCL7988404.1 hypothetical protein [Sphingobacterium sp. lm-10]
MKNLKKSYSRPMVNVMSLTTEYGIAASSVMVSGGSEGTPYQPTVENWEIGGEGYGSTDL